MTLRDEIANAGHREALEAVRDRIADELDNSDSSSAVASLARQLTVVLEKLESLPTAERSGLDDLEQRRADRRAAAVAKRSAGS